jgi:hypothetical protein
MTWPSYCLKLKRQKQCSGLFCFICNTTECTHKNNHKQIRYFKYSFLAWTHCYGRLVWWRFGEIQYPAHFMPNRDVPKTDIS